MCCILGELLKDPEVCVAVLQVQRGSVYSRLKNLLSLTAYARYKIVLPDRVAASWEVFQKAGLLFQLWD